MNITLKNYGIKEAKRLSIGLVLLVASGITFAQQETVGYGQAKPETSGQTSFKYKEQRTFRMDIPSRWVSESPEHPGMIAKYASNLEGDHKVRIYRYFDPRDNAPRIHLDNAERDWRESGHTNLVRTETTLESGEASVLHAEYIRDEDNIIRYHRVYVMQRDKHTYTVGFATDNKDMFELFDQMVNSIRVSAR